MSDKISREALFFLLIFLKHTAQTETSMPHASPTSLWSCSAPILPYCRAKVFRFWSALFRLSSFIPFQLLKTAHNYYSINRDISTPERSVSLSTGKRHLRSPCVTVTGGGSPTPFG